MAPLEALYRRGDRVTPSQQTQVSRLKLLAAEIALIGVWRDYER